MSVIDIEKLASPISAESPCGPDLRFSPAYVELEEAVRGKPEAQFGDIIRPAEEPNWPNVLDRCVELTARTKDLRVAMHLILAATHVHGLAGMADGLGLLRQLIERHWAGLYPLLDAEDNNDPTERVNRIAALSPTGDYADRAFLRAIREAPLCGARQTGWFSYRDVLAAQGDSSVKLPSDQVAPDLRVIKAGFAATELEELKGTVGQLDGAIEQLAAISKALEQQVGPQRAPSLEGLRRLLATMRHCVGEHLAQRDGSAPPEPEGAVAADEQTGPAQSTVGGGSGLGDIRSRADVLEAIDRICAFYERTEPSSPVPLLLRRAKRLVSKGFVDIIRDLSPEAMAQIQLIGGLDKPPG